METIDRKIKVLHINCNYMDSWLHQTMIEELEKKSIKNNVFVPLHTRKGHIVTPKKYVKTSVCFKKYDRLLYHYKQFKIYKSIVKQYDILNYDCIHAYTVFTDGNVARKLSKKFKIPYVVAVRNTDINIFFRYMPHLRKTGINIMKNAKAVFFLSEASKRNVMEKYVPKKIKKQIVNKSYVIPNGIDDFWHNNMYVERKKLNNKIKSINTKHLELIYVGNIDKNKNITTTCAAKEELEKDGWTVNFIVVGKIKNKNVYKEIKDKIEYKGILKKEELIQLYRNADIFIMPSHRETFGLVYAEAISQGIPVIYTKGQGFDEQFKEGEVGYGIDSRRVSSVKNAIIEVINHYEKIASNLPSKIGKFSWNKITDKYIDIYKNIIGDYR